MVKLLDYEDRWEELERSDNPFALLAMAQLRTQATKGKPESRLEWKLRLLDWLYEHHRDKEDVFLDLFRFMDWMMALPEELEHDFKQTAERREEERRMPIISHIERKAEERGFLRMARQAVLEVIEARFGQVPQAIADSVQHIADVEMLRKLHRTAVVSGSLQDFQQALPA